MTFEVNMSWADAGKMRKKSRKWRLLQEMNDGQLLIDGKVEQPDGVRMTTADGDDLVGLTPERVDSDMTAPYRSTHDMPWAPVWSWPVPADAASVVPRGRRSRGRIATESEHQTSCSVKHGLKTSLEVDRKPDEYEVAIVEPGVDERDH